MTITDVQMIDTTYVEQMSRDKGMILWNCFNINFCLKINILIIHFVSNKSCSTYRCIE